MYIRKFTAPGKCHCYRYSENQFPGDLEAIHGGGEARFPIRLDISRCYRKKSVGVFETDFEYLRSHSPSRFDCIVASSLYSPGLFHVLRQWTPDRREGRFTSFAWRMNRLTSLFDAVAFDTGDMIAGGYLLSYPIVRDLKTRFLNAGSGVCDSILTGRQERYHSRFSSSQSNLRGINRSCFDVLRDWTPDVYHCRFDRRESYALLIRGGFESAIDPVEWPLRIRSLFPGIAANPVFHQFRATGKHDPVELLRWTIFAFIYDAFLYYHNDYSADRQAFVRPGWCVMAKNLETEQIIDLGFIDEYDPSRSLENISLPDGDYEISVLTSSMFWKDTMDGNIRTISVRPGEEVLPLPVIYNLRSSVSFGTRTIQWSASHSEIDECLFGVWYSAEPFSGQATNGSGDSGGEAYRDGTARSPDVTVWYSSSMTEYQTSFAQNAPAWVAVAAMRLDEENQIGKVHELYLDWSSAPPRAPDDVMVLAEPLPAIDSEIFERPIEEEDLALVF